MKFLLSIFLLVFFITTFSFQASAKKIKINTKFSSENVTVYSFDRPIVISEKHDPKNITDSEITFKIGGVLEGHLCGYRNPSLQLKFNGYSPSFPDENYDVSVMSLIKSDKVIQLNDYACSDVSMTKKFEVLVKVNPTFWASSDKVTWTYRFVNEWGDNKKLVVTLSEKKGWSWEFEPL